MKRQLFFILLAGLVFSFAGRDAQSASWSFEKSEGKDSSYYGMQNTSDDPNIVEGIVFGGHSLMLYCSSDTREIKAFLSIVTPNPNQMADTPRILKYQVDNGELVEEKWENLEAMIVSLQGTIDAPISPSFIERIKNGKTLYVKVLYETGEKATASFDLSGFEDYYRKLLFSCAD